LLVRRIRRPQGKKRAVVMVTADSGRAVEPLAHLHQRSKGSFTVAGPSEGMEDGEMGTVRDQAENYPLLVLSAEFRRAVVVAPGGAEESVIVGIAVVAGVFGEDMEYLVLPGGEIVAENHTGTLTSIRQGAAQARHAEQGACAREAHRSVGLFASGFVEVVKDAKAGAVDAHFV